MLATKSFTPDNFKRINAFDLNLDYIRKHGLNEPMLVLYPMGLDMDMPRRDITVDDIAGISLYNWQILLDEIDLLMY